MLLRLLPFLVILTLLVPSSSSAAVDPSGWGDSFPWVDYSDAFRIAQEEDKPVMLVIWRPWCGACKNLRPRFAASKAIEAQMSSVVMVHVADELQPAGSEQYTPDGGYFPRIIFVEKDGNIMDDITNVGGNAKYKYFYHEDSAIAGSMSRAAAKAAARTAAVESVLSGDL